MNNVRRIDEKQVNQMLMSNGLGSLDDPGLIPQLRFLVAHVIRTHEQFRELINRCEGSKRRDLYEALHSALSFEPKPLDVYIAELGEIAERQQLPIQNPDGTLRAFKVPEIRDLVAQSREASRQIGEEYDADFRAGQREEEEHIAQASAEAAVANKFLELTCRSCTYYEFFSGWNKQACIDKARVSGWRAVHSDARDEDAELCPRCIETYWPSLK